MKYGSAGGIELAKWQEKLEAELKLRDPAAERVVPHGCAEYFHTPHTSLFCGYLLATGLAAAAAFSSARNMRVFSRNAIFCFRSLL
jgi:hypothetical protein